MLHLRYNFIVGGIVGKSDFASEIRVFGEYFSDFYFFSYFYGFSKYFSDLCPKKVRDSGS